MMDTRSTTTHERGPHGARARLPLVHLRYQGHPIGLYGIREAGEQVIDLRQGPIAFPVGTELLIEDLMGVSEGARPRMFQGTVTHSDGLGMSIEI